VKFSLSLIEVTLIDIPFCVDHTIWTPTETRNEIKNEKHIVWLDMEVCNYCELYLTAQKEEKNFKDGIGFFR